MVSYRLLIEACVRRLTRLTGSLTGEQALCACSEWRDASQDDPTDGTSSFAPARHSGADRAPGDLSSRLGSRALEQMKLCPGRSLTTISSKQREREETCSSQRLTREYPGARVLTSFIRSLLMTLAAGGPLSKTIKGRPMQSERLMQNRHSLLADAPTSTSTTASWLPQLPCRQCWFPDTRLPGFARLRHTRAPDRRTMTQPNWPASRLGT